MEKRRPLSFRKVVVGSQADSRGLDSRVGARNFQAGDGHGSWSTADGHGGWCGCPCDGAFSPGCAWCPDTEKSRRGSYPAVFCLKVFGRSELEPASRRDRFHYAVTCFDPVSTGDLRFLICHQG